ncbi:NAD(+) diphosphatase [Microbacterium sp. KSW2-21]|uniref:NAD(+) diphosphatase n=2 Tax=Microbacteriaceae TaxID=85023 RepID=A0ABU3RVH4_9MICO|nr:NAD(+) diphosphatase [Microbacterium sp. KSW2-21]MDU0326886.1 NAD(+) diphosphatase [Microbacterium sp. KSW2-21]
MSLPASSSSQNPPSSSAADSGPQDRSADAADLAVDRAGAERDQPGLLGNLAADPRTLVLAVRRDAAPLIDGRLAFVSFADLASSAAGSQKTAGLEASASAGPQHLTEHAASAPSPQPAEPSASAESARPAEPMASALAGSSAPAESARPAESTASAESARPAEPAASAPAPSARPAAPDAAAPHDIPGITHWAFLGRTPDHRAVLLAVVADGAGDELVPDADWAPLRAAGGDLPAGEAELLTAAVALSGWLRDAAFCPACGALTELRQAGWSRHCPVCGREHFPRTDPAVIVLLTSAEGDRVLLGANAAWGGDRYSCFAGFAEAGESLEDAVAREVNEESGVRLREIVYRGSQAWPYPRSLMLGFRAVVVDEVEALADGEEIVEVRWFTREEIGSALRGESAVHLPGAASIARRLIEDWYGETA